MEKDKMFLIVVGVILALIVIALLLQGSVQPQENIQEETELTKEYFDGHFARVEQGIVSSTIDVCFSLNGFYLTGSDGKLLVQDYEVPIDENTGVFRKVSAITCVFPQVPSTALK